MIPLKDILYKVSIEAVVGSTYLSINKLEFDSRKVSSHDLFVAIRGTISDGHQYIDKALENGALVIVCEETPKRYINGITYIKVPDTASALAVMAANYYDNPSRDLKLVGITGTNGKTTIATLLFQLFKKAGYKTGLLSTVEIRVDNALHPATHTTPDSLTINRYLKEMNQAGVEYCFMEVSSHGIHQKRSGGLYFTGGVFTNLTHDHLDYHPSFAAYRDVKKAFFDALPKDAFALVNIDDKNGLVMFQNTKARKYTYSMRSYADYRAKVMESQFGGMLLKIGDREIWTRLIGGFNAYNILAIYAVADLLDLEPVEILQHISELETVRGRFEYVTSKDKITAVVDYAHTPDALKNVLQTINSIRTGNETLITVVGCGGDRDIEKRPNMAHIASSLSTKAIFTSDNPRNEDPQRIIEDMEKGVEPQNYKKTLSITDRKQAIRTACQMANPEDIILIAGKGHETYQEIRGERIDFDDMEVVKECLKALKA